MDASTFGRRDANGSDRFPYGWGIDGSGSLDGYYILIYWLDRPDLRPQALEWLGGRLRSGRRARDGRSHRTDLAFGVMSLLYIPLGALISVRLYQTVASRWMRQVFPESLASSLVWVVALLDLSLTLLAVAGELGGVQAPAES